jgi:beta-lactamase class A
MRLNLTALLLFISLTTFAQRTDNKLQKQIEDIIKGFNGDIGIYVHDLKHDKIVSLNADTIFPTASIVKISILIGIMIHFITAKAMTFSPTSKTVLQLN